jgi:ADP-ribose pyrophosphatase YjhB (NUDIX family)
LTIVQLCSGLLRRGDRVLLTRCRYPEESEPLWTLPGGRQEERESKAQTVIREFWEEASLRIRVGALAYASESVDNARDIHVMNATFFVEDTEPQAEPRAQDVKVTEVRFVPIAQAPALLRADVLRIPVEAALSARLERCFFSFTEANIRVPFFSAARRGSA